MKPLTKLRGMVDFAGIPSHRDVYLASEADARIKELEASIAEANEYIAEANKYVSELKAERDAARAECGNA